MFIVHLAGSYHSFVDVGDRGNFFRSLPTYGQLNVFFSREPDNVHDRFAIKVIFVEEII